MRLHYLQHVPFEVPGAVRAWAEARGWQVTGTHLYRGEPLPSAEEFDWLVVMGGPMNVYEEDVHPWLVPEKALIDDAVAARKVVVGVCLGAQLLADVLGGTVTRNEWPEIGWFPVTVTAAGAASPAFGRLPQEFTALHWHGDTFSLPPGAVHLAESAACVNQAFSYGDRAFGLQFHLECTTDELRDLVTACRSELVDGPWISSSEELMGRAGEPAASNGILSALLDGIAEATAP